LMPYKFLVCVACSTNVRKTFSAIGFNEK
jgi:hypothetical protein